jgi:O-antigen/teichoic acid export membrane protein
VNPLSLLKKRAQKLSPTSRKGLKGVGWAGSTQAITTLVRLASNLILTRLLAPEAFGILGTATAILDTLTFFSDVGLVPALVRHPQGHEREYLLTAWWINLGRLTLIGLSLMLLSFPLAQFYKQPGLAPVVFVVALRPILMGLRSPGMPLLQRDMRFRDLYLNEVILQVITVMLSVTLVWFYRSPVSLAVGTMIATALSAAVSYLFVPIKPVWLWDATAAKELGQFGRKIFVNTLAMALWMNVDRVLGLRLLPPRAMGFYSIAWNLCSILNLLFSRLCGVYYAMLLKKPEGEARLDWHNIMSRRLGAWIMPPMALGIVAAPVVIDILYQDHWRPAAPLLALLVGQSMMRFLNTFEFQYLMATAAVSIQTRAYIAAAAVQAALLVPLTHTWGPAGMAASSLISAIVLTGAQAVLMRFKTGRGGFVSFGLTLAWVSAGLVVYWLIWRP